MNDLLSLLEEIGVEVIMEYNDPFNNRKPIKKSLYKKGVSYAYELLSFFYKEYSGIESFNTREGTVLPQNILWKLDNENKDSISFGTLFLLAMILFSGENFDLVVYENGPDGKKLLIKSFRISNTAYFNKSDSEEWKITRIRTAYNRALEFQRFILELYFNKILSPNTSKKYKIEFFKRIAKNEYAKGYGTPLCDLNTLLAMKWETYETIKRDYNEKKDFKLPLLDNWKEAPNFVIGKDRKSLIDMILFSMESTKEWLPFLRKLYRLDNVYKRTAPEKCPILPIVLLTRDIQK